MTRLLLGKQSILSIPIYLRKEFPYGFKNCLSYLLWNRRPQNLCCGLYCFDDKLLENPLDTSFDVEPLIHGSMKDKIPELELAIDGFITPEQAILYSRVSCDGGRLIFSYSIFFKKSSIYGLFAMLFFLLTTSMLISISSM